VDGISVKANQFGEAQARLGRDQQQGVIAAAKPRRSIGHGENRLDLGARQEVHLPLVVALAWYGEHALDQPTVYRLLEGQAIQLAFCLAHTRRKFVKVYKTMQSPFAHEVIERLQAGGICMPNLSNRIVASNCGPMKPRGVAWNGAGGTCPSPGYGWWCRRHEGARQAHRKAKAELAASFGALGGVVVIDAAIDYPVNEAGIGFARATLAGQFIRERHERITVPGLDLRGMLWIARSW
jgi:hypothetical protein